MNYNEVINDINKVFKFKQGIIVGPVYNCARRQLAKIYLELNQELEAIHQLVESHGLGLRQAGLLRIIKDDGGPLNSVTECLSFINGYALDGSEGMIRRLKEMPAEWTIVQLTREFDPLEIFHNRTPESSPKLKGFHLTRFPCGSELQSGCPITVERCWPETAEKDLLEIFWGIKKKLGTKNAPSSLIRKMRKEAANDAESYCKEIGPVSLKEWLVLLLGRLCDSQLQSQIREKVDEVLKRHSPVSKRQRYLLYLLAEGAAHLNEEELEDAIFQLVEENRSLQEELFQCITVVKEMFSTLPVAKRHPVILIIDEHLDLIPWENLMVLKRHPMTRVPSLHFIHALYKIHKDHIKMGLREIPEEEICYYIVNPEGDLPTLEENLSKFLIKRFPSWIGIIGQKPKEEQLIEALTNCNTFVYCGHGSGCQYMTSETVLKLKVKPVQLLFGCSSVALKDHGGIIEMSGDVLQFIVAGSGCTVGMLWPVTSNDTDILTMNLANIWLPGTPIDITSLTPIPEGKTKKEPELLRAIGKVKDSVSLFTNHAGFVARGLPIKLVKSIK